MFCGPAMKFGARLLCVVAAIIACACRAEPGSLTYSAKEAKRQGKQAITIRHIFDEIGSEAPLDGFLRAYATVLATPVGASVQTTDNYYVYTWHFFHVLRILAQPPSPSVPGCRVSPPRALAADEIAIPLVAGTAVIEGVAITMDSDESHATFKPGQQYLFLVSPHDLLGEWRWLRRAAAHRPLRDSS